MKPAIFVTRNIAEPALKKLAQYFDLTVNPKDRVLTQAEIIEGVKNKDALLCLLTDQIDKAILDNAPKLKVISNYAVGFNNIDIKEATKRGIPVCITPGILTNATADLTFALILAVTRRLIEADHYMRSGQFSGWAPDLFLGSELQGKTLGIIGMGRIGYAVAKRAMGFEMNILYFSKTPKDIPGATFVPLQTLFERSDIISLHTPLTSETHHLIGARELSLMKKSAYLINTTRGLVVDEHALVEALKTGKIAGAGLDVYENEPLASEGLNSLNNVVMLPHIGSATIETRTKMALLAADNAIDILEGKKPFAVANPEVLNIHNINI